MPFRDTPIKDLVICEHCGSRVEDSVPFCPTCGYPLPEIASLQPGEEKPRKSPTWIWLLGFVLTVGCLFLGILGAGVLGVYDGLKERATLNRQAAVEHYERGVAHLEANEYELAIAEFDLALRLDPSHVEAAEKLREAEALARALPTPTSETWNQALRMIFEEAQALYREGKWVEAATKLEQVKSLDSTYESDQVREMLFGAYYNQGLQLVSEGRIEEALRLFDQALEVWPGQEEAMAQQKLAALYVEALSYWGADWRRAIEVLTQLYKLAPDYRDVASRLAEAYARYGDVLASQADWCQAQAQYQASLDMRPNSDLEARRDDAASRCLGVTVTPARPFSSPPSPSPPVPAPPVQAKATTTPRTTTTPAAAVAATPTPTSTITATMTGGTEAGGSGPQGTIYYTTYEGVQGVVQAVPAGSGEPRRVLTMANQPAVSPDGLRLLYHAQAGDRIGLHVARIGGGEDVRVTTFAEDGFPSWSPDGKQLVFASTREGDRQWRIYVAGAGGSNGVSLGLGHYPAWSPDGKLIAYHGCDQRGDNCGIYITDPGATTRRQLTSGSSDTAPSWSPDGRQLAFMSARDGNWEIYLVGGDGGKVTRLTYNSANDGLPVWSPYGGQIAFVSDRGGSWEIYVMSANGDEVTQVIGLGPGWPWGSEKISWGK
jgi:Tol biopolymer transport system component/Tfp pilus assembly protein PilF